MSQYGITINLRYTLCILFVINLFLSSKVFAQLIGVIDSPLTSKIDNQIVRYRCLSISDKGTAKIPYRGDSSPTQRYYEEYRYGIASTCANGATSTSGINTIGARELLSYKYYSPTRYSYHKLDVNHSGRMRHGTTILKKIVATNGKANISYIGANYAESPNYNSATIILPEDRYASPQYLDIFPHGGLNVNALREMNTQAISVLNLSWGRYIGKTNGRNCNPSSERSTTEQIKRLYDKGTLVVAANGQNSSGSIERET